MSKCLPQEKKLFRPDSRKLTVAPVISHFFLSEPRSVHLLHPLCIIKASSRLQSNTLATKSAERQRKQTKTGRRKKLGSAAREVAGSLLRLAPRSSARERPESNSTRSAGSPSYADVDALPFCSAHRKAIHPVLPWRLQDQPYCIQISGPHFFPPHFLLP